MGDKYRKVKTVHTLSNIHQTKETISVTTKSREIGDFVNLRESSFRFRQLLTIVTF